MHTCNPNIQETETGGYPQVPELTELQVPVFSSQLPQKAAEVTVERYLPPSLATRARSLRPTRKKEVKMKFPRAVL